MTPDTTFLYNNRKYYLSTTNKRYYATDIYFAGKRTKKQLHHAIWEDAHGMLVPKGHAIHHVDGNPFNNSPDNLEALPRGEHQRQHMAIRYSDAQYREQNSKHLESVRAKAADWHRSKLGRATASKIAIDGWLDRIPSERICIECNGVFDSRATMKVKFCNYRCAQRFHYRARTYHETRQCFQCNKAFSVRKSEDTKCCSKSCAGLMRKFQHLQKDGRCHGPR